jgi:hypothetical protein
MQTESETEDQRQSGSDIRGSQTRTAAEASGKKRVPYLGGECDDEMAHELAPQTTHLGRVIGRQGRG